MYVYELNMSVDKAQCLNFPSQSQVLVQINQYIINLSNKFPPSPERFTSDGLGGSLTIGNGQRLNKGGYDLLRLLMYRVRTDQFPELMDMSINKLRDIEHQPEEGIVEKTHIVFTELKNKLYCAIEFNMAGAKMNNLLSYMRVFGKKIFHKTFEVSAKEVIGDNATDILNRIGVKKSVSLVVLRSAIPQTQPINQILHDALVNMNKVIGSKEITICWAEPDLKRDALGLDKGDSDSILRTIIRFPMFKNIFKKLTIRGRDQSSGGNIETFELIDIKQREKIKIKRTNNKSSLESSKVFPKLEEILTKYMDKI